MAITTIGLDIAKRVFQAHGVDASDKAVLRRKLQRAEVLKFFTSLPRCLVGIEACSTAHYWARAITTRGHEVRLLPASYRKPYVKRGKTDAADAEAICEAVTRPTMRFVPIKTAEQQAVLMLHRMRVLVRQRTQMAWLRSLLDRRPVRLVSVAQANKTARIVWSLLTKGGTYRTPAANRVVAA